MWPEPGRGPVKGKPMLLIFGDGSVEENRGLPELSSAAKFIGGKPQASHLRIVRFTLMALCAHLLSERRNRVACV